MLSGTSWGPFFEPLAVTPPFFSLFLCVGPDVPCSRCVVPEFPVVHKLPPASSNCSCSVASCMTRLINKKKTLGRVPDGGGGVGRVDGDGDPVEKE